MTKTRTIRPLGDRVLIRPAKPADESGGLVIPSVAQQQPMEGEVIAVGPEVPLEVWSFHAGATVLYGKYAGNEVESNGETLLMLKLGDVMGVIEDGEDA